MSYFDELTVAMTTLSQHPSALFVGQSVRYDGQAMHKTFANVPMDQRIEMPVAENLQMGFCTGLALAGYLPICIFPRFDFMILAMDALVNHLDKLPLIGPDKLRPKVIIRVAVGATEPINPGPQHCQNYTEALRLMLKTVHIIDLPDASYVRSGYELALNLRQSVIVVEHMAEYQR